MRMSMLIFSAHRARWLWLMVQPHQNKIRLCLIQLKLRTDCVVRTSELASSNVNENNVYFFETIFTVVGRSTYSRMHLSIHMKYSNQRHL